MKIFIFILFFLGFIGVQCSMPIAKEEMVSLKIEAIPEGINIYNEKNELVLEFTTENCDTESLETLHYIYEALHEKEGGELKMEKVIVQNREN